MFLWPPLSTVAYFAGTFLEAYGTISCIKFYSARIDVAQFGIKISPFHQHLKEKNSQGFYFVSSWHVTPERRRPGAKRMRNQRPAKYLPGNLQSHGKCCPLEAAGWAEVSKLFAQIWARLPVKPGPIYHFKSNPVGISRDCRWDPVASQGFCSLSWGNQTLSDTMLEIFFPWAPANRHRCGLCKDKVLEWLEGKFH